MIHTISHWFLFLTKRIFDIVVISILCFVGINASILIGTRHHIYQTESIGKDVLQGGMFDAVIVLGASVQGMKLSPVLQDRVETAIQLYNAGKTTKIIISGDNGKKYYNEVDAMYTYLRNRAIPFDDIIIDDKGYNTFLSIRNLRTIQTSTQLHTIGIITQKFHLPRAVFIAQALGLNPIGIISDRASYTENKQYAIREMFARIKSFVEVVIWRVK